MEALFGILGASLLGSIVYLVAWATRNDTASVLRESAGRAGLTGMKLRTSLGLEQAVTGSLDGLRVELGSYDAGGGVRGTRIVVRGMGHGPFGLTVRPESVGKAFERVFDGGEYELGDPAFDAVAYVQGDPSIARAVLGIPARKGLAELLRGRLGPPGPGGETLEVSASLAGDALTVEIPREAKSGAAFLPAALGSLAALAKDLVLSGDAPARIAANLPAEEPAGVRLGHVKLLAREFPDLPVTRDALRAACRDADARVRLEAAEALGEEGRETLLGVASAEDAREEDATRAVETLGRRLPPADAARLLDSALGASRFRLARACVTALGLAEGIDPGSEAAAALERALLSPVEEVAAAAARSLASADVVSSETGLVGALGHAEADVRLAAAEALGRVGTIAAVAPLQECGAAHALDLSLRRATRQAIGEIQSRAPGASPGQLSLAAASAGQVSLAPEGEEGRLSLPPHGDTEG